MAAIKFDAEQRKTFSDLQTKLSNATHNLASATDDNRVERINEYNSVARDIEEFRSDVADSYRNEFDDRTEKWQESETGEAVDEWISEWEEFTIDEIAIDDELTADGLDEVNSVLDAFNQLSDQPQD